MNAPAIGRTVLYTLSASDAADIKRRRARYNGSLKFNPAEAGQTFPAIVVRVDESDDATLVSLQVLLDGEDCFWAPHRLESDPERLPPVQSGRWHWPVINITLRSADKPTEPVSVQAMRLNLDRTLRMDCLRIATDFLKERAGGTPAEFLAFAADIFAFAQRETPTATENTVAAGDEMTDLSRKLEIALRRNPKYAQSWTNVIASTLQNVGINEESAPDLAKRLMRILFKTDV